MKILQTVLLLLVFGLLLASAVRGQGPGTIQSAGASSSCVLPPAGSSSICIAGDKILASTNGAAWVQIGVATAAAGVTSVSVNGGTAQTGAVSLSIPSSFIGTSFTVTPAGKIQ